ncbi:MOP flippase family protein [Draconibacterium sediminis]|uniref:MOP flippase family protein n=1 Tax=Draconibacterium sediminis TaxID=1544798 RepID=UPI0026F2EA15|nr:MOP flippase family protein [Draconibacterium sediminis]
MSLRKKAVAGVKWTTIGTMGRAIFQLLQVSILTRFLPKEAFGLVAMALFIVQFSNIFIDMGMSSAILHRQNATKNEYSSIYWLNIFISIALYGILFISTPFVSNFYNEPELNKLVPILGTNLLLMASGRQHRTIMQKQFRFKKIATTELISYFCGLITATLLALKGFGVYSLVYSTLLASFLSNALFLLQNLRLNPIMFHFSLIETKPFLKVGGFTMGSTVLDFFSREIDVLIIGKMLGAESLGVYSLAKQIVLKIYSFVNPIILNVLNPILASIQKEKNKVKEYYLKIIYLLATINAPIYLLIIILSKEILGIVYGPDYISGFWVLSFLAFSYGLNTIANPVGSLQIATGRTDIGFKWTIIRVIVTPICIYFASLIDINTVAAIIAIVSVTLIIPMWRIQLKPIASIRLDEYLKQFMKPFIMILFVSGIVLILDSLYDFSNGNIIINALLKIGLGSSFYILLTYLWERQRYTEIYKLGIKVLRRYK